MEMIFDRLVFNISTSSGEDIPLCVCVVKDGVTITLYAYGVLAQLFYLTLTTA